ncbi:MAG: rRNA pseudouridine synthase [Kiritimatiellae bacterium]|nr:rRNA pseudouridine synthase [Kiritimatiellia bacterium]
MEERLQKILAGAGVASRRHCEELIAAGRVAVNGKVAVLGTKAVAGRDSITIDGKPLRIDAAAKHRTIMLYKPVGVLSTMHDDFGGETLADFLRAKRIRERLVPVGRLDRDSEGLLLMTDDGELAYRLTHPKFEHEKVYVVRAAGRWRDEMLSTLQSPLVIDGYTIRPCKVELVREGRDNVHTLKFHLREGRKRQIRRMCSAAHLVVLSLKRISLGSLRLDPALRPGEFRDLTHAELESLAG